MKTSIGYKPIYGNKSFINIDKITNNDNFLFSITIENKRDKDFYLELIMSDNINLLKKNIFITTENNNYLININEIINTTELFREFKNFRPTKIMFVSPLINNDLEIKIN
ncbi:MAG: hypothetical protein KA325_01340 [Flavobacterium sp.]|nr:hypothetical protein [Flavobacterium sp.]